jgi:hypothetical protein
MDSSSSRLSSVATDSDSTLSTQAHAEGPLDQDPSARARTRAQFLGAVRVGIGPIASWGAIWSGAAWEGWSGAACAVQLLGRGSVSVTAVVCMGLHLCSAHDCVH